MSRPYIVIAAQPVSPSVMVYTLQAANMAQPMRYLPGQYATLSFDQHGRPTPARCFSIASSPTEPDLLQFGMRIHGDYTTTAALYLMPGNKVRVGGPYGKFIYNPQRDTTAVFLAGGIGITPFMSMIRYATKARLQNNILLIYSCRDQNDMPFMDELLYAQTVNPRLRVVFALTGGGNTSRMAGTQFIYGNVTPQTVYSLLGGAMIGPTYFICGPAGFMDSMVRGLRAYHVPDKKVLTEAFASASQKAGLFMSLPSHVYTLTALSVAVGTGMTIMSDTIAANAKLAAKNKTGDVAFGNRGANAGTNTRSGTVDGTIGDLNNGNTTGGTDGDTTSDGTTGTDGTGTTGDNGGTNNGGSGNSWGGTTGGTGGGTTVTKPTVNLSVVSTSVIRGRSTTLIWSVSGTSPTCTASGGWSGSKGTSGSLSISPTNNTTYTLSCSNSAGSDAKSVSVSVADAPVAPDVTISISPSTITAGQSATLSWSVSGTSPTCTASGGWSGVQNASGSKTITPGSSTTYTLSCSNDAGSNSKSASITVNAAPVITKPTISFSASSTTITAGESTNLSWSVSGTSPTCTASGGWSGSKGTSGSQSVSPGSTTTYNLSCSNSAGSDSKSVTINVNPASGGS